MRAKVSVTERVESERSDEVTELSMKQQEDGAEEGGKKNTLRVKWENWTRREEGGSACLPPC